MKKTVVFDFDGVIHSYVSGWDNATTIMDVPTPGIREVIDELKQKGYEIIINSTRCKEHGGIEAIALYCKLNEIYYNFISDVKPAAVAYVDDRAIFFDGDPDSLVEKIENMNPWSKSDDYKHLEDACGYYAIIEGIPVFINDPKSQL